jgi:hypothetical protein
MAVIKKTQKTFGFQIVALILIIGLSACHSTSDSNNEILSQLSPEEPIPTTFPEPAETAFAVDELVEVNVNECLECHTNKQALIERFS